uniref:Uncharacterized protein n=1 Tax=Heterorhabditis bacteriophora TaxID=37862 RepID=A0A1I7WCG3_HETBA
MKSSRLCQQPELYQQLKICMTYFRILIFFISKRFF